MNLSEARKLYGKRLMQVTLCLFITENTLLLAVKKRKIGKGLWNGPGGKIDVGETTETAMIREAREELGMTPTAYTKCATLEFYLLDQPEWNMLTHVFLVTAWEGEPTETAEMGSPSWFSTDSLPWDTMWPDDKLWLPQVVQGQIVRAAFLLNSDGVPVESEVNLSN